MTVCAVGGGFRLMEFYDLKQQRLAVLMGELQPEAEGIRRWASSNSQDPFELLT